MKKTFYYQLMNQLKTDYQKKVISNMVEVLAPEYREKICLDVLGNLRLNSLQQYSNPVLSFTYLKILEYLYEENIK